jgi:hypothetical protein
MRKRLFNQQSEPRSREAQKTWRLSVKAKIMMALLALMLIPQGTWAQIEYYRYNASSGAFEKDRVSSYTTLSGSTDVSKDVTLSSGTYVCSRNDVSYAGRLIITGIVNIILCDGAKLDAWSGVGVDENATLTIYGQGKGTGQLNAYGYNHNIGTYDQYAGAAIGGYYHNDSQNNVTSLSKCGTIVIHGGIITANSSSSGLAHDAAGIGGWASDAPRDLTIYGGNITASGGTNGAGIGGGGKSSSGAPSSGGTVSIYGGNITATGGACGAGIGGGILGGGGTVKIYGGEVIATGGDGDNSYGEAKGIGAGSNLTPAASGLDDGTLTIYDNVTCDDGTNVQTGTSTPTNITNREKIMKTDYQYALTVGVKQVKASIASNIFGSTPTATASFNATTNTLVLDDLDINGNIESGLDNLTIEIIDDNNITSGHIKSTNTTATLRIKKGADGSLKLNNTNGNSAVEGFASVDLEDVYLHASNCCKYVVNGTTRAYQYPETDTPYLSNVQDLEFTTTHYYPLWVGSQQVSEANKGNINFLGTGTASFKPSTSGINTLTLDGVLIDSSNGIESGLDNLTIALKGVNSINTNTAYHYYPIYSNVATAPLTIKKDETATNCSLTLSSSTNSPQVVKGFDPVTSSTNLDLEVTEGSGTITDASLKGVILRSLSFSGGDGTSSNPYLIATKEDLNDLATIVNFGALDTSSKYFSVTTDIDCSGLTNFEPIGSSTHAFKGTFGTIDNKNKTISNLQVNASDYAGLFGYVSGGTISNLTLHNCTIIGDNSYGVSYAGALAGTVDGASTISYNMVTGTTTVSVSTTNGTNKGYAGAIFGYYQSGTLSKNCYEYTVTVTGDDAVAKTGYTPRGDGFTGGDIAASDGAVLYTQTLSTATISNGTIVPWPIPSNTYTNNGKFPPGQTAYFKVTPSTGYAIDASSPKVTYTTATGASQTINGVLEANESSDGVNVYSFTMPDATDATATASLLVNISDAVYSAAIDPVTYSPTGSLAPTTVKLTPKGGTTITLSNTGTNNDFTITGIVDHSGNPVTEFTKADTYKVTIQGQGSYTGTKANIGYTIEQAQVAITQAPTAIAGLTYDGSLHNLVNPGTVTGGTMKYSLDYNAAIADWTTTVPQGKNATDSPYNVYYMVEGDANYIGVAKSTNNKVEVTISPKTISNANTVISLNSSSFVYSSSSSQQPSITSVSVDNTQLTETQDYVATIPNGTDVNTYTVTITGNGNYTGNATTTFDITLAPITPSVSITGWTYGSAANTPTVTGNPGNGGISYDYKKSTDADSEYSGTAPTAAGTYTVRATIAATANYQGGTATANFTIDQATLTSVEIDQTQFVYDPTKERVVNVTKVMAGTVEVPVGSYEIVSNSNKATDRGTHTVTVQGKAGSNFKGTASTTFVITERTVNIDFGGRTFRTFYDANEPFLVPDNMTAYIVTGVSGNAVTTKKVSYIQAGVPVLLEKTPGTTNVVDPAESYVGNKLKYAAAATPATEKHYVLYNNEFVRASGTINGKVYLDLTGYSGGARTLVIGDGTTAVEGIVSEEDDDAKWYDMQGRRINKPTKSGLYIKDGKKVVVKTRY